MSKLEDQLVNMLRTAKEDTRNDISLEEKLGIKICTSEEDHIFVLLCFVCSVIFDGCQVS